MPFPLLRDDRFGKVLSYGKYHTQKDRAAPWTNDVSYYGSGESFVFTTVPTFQVFNWQRTNSMFMFSNEDAIAMGGGGGFAWYLNSDLSHGSTAVSETFDNRPLTSQHDFEVAHCEVWGFAMF